jgi:(1->4)-alpha-D-glucan 1-alpha-D-glucosylmutase
VLLLDGSAVMPSRRAGALLAFVMAWQQYTGPVTAKAVEDTALYRDTALLARNDVGLDPGQAAVTIDEFHRRNRFRRKEHPATLVATATHDTKRGEDVRARLAVLTEMAEEWIGILDRWRTMNSARRHRVDGHEAPDLAEEWLLYQTLVGIWPPPGGEPIDASPRLAAYLEKAMREAKVHTSWLDPDQHHERAVLAFARDVLRRRSEFRRDVDRVAAGVAWFGAMNAISQLALKCTAPGVPDIYQGTELWDLTLVDPDNRRPLDVEARRAALAGVRARLESEEAVSVASELLVSWADGRIKLFVLHQLLRLRSRLSEVFARGSYRAVEVQGEKATHVVAFTRRAGGREVLTVAPRWFTRLAPAGRPPIGGEVWGDTALVVGGGAGWRDALTGIEIAAESGRLMVGDVVRALPVAALEAGPLVATGK